VSERPTTRPAASTDRVDDLLAALADWQRDPGPVQLRALRDVIAGALERAGLAGAWIDLDADPIPPLRLGIGSLLEPPTGPHRATLSEFDLAVDRGRRLAGRVWLDAGEGPNAPTDPLTDDRVREALRAVELGLDTAWSSESARRSAAQLEALDAATRGIAGVLSVDRVLQLICDRTRDLVRAEYAALGIADADGVLERFVTSGISRADRERIGALPEGHGLLGLIIGGGRSFRIADIAGHPRSYGFPPHHPRMTSFLGVPITVKGKAVGDLYLTNKRGAREFSEADQTLVEMFALHAGIAIENARLHEQVQRLAIVEERERIGKDLHDGIIQGIYGVGLSLEDVPELMDDDPEEARARIERAIERLNLTIREIRNLIFGLRPELLDQVGLLGGLAGLADEFRLNTMVDVELEGAQDAIPEPGDEATIQLLQIAREALSNIARHANATRARIVLRVERSGDPEADELVLEISDNGRGFSPNAPRGPGHHGMANMRARAKALGGSFDLHSEPAGGTRIIVRVPGRRDA
jgi:signal transduction histidine kinase